MAGLTDLDEAARSRLTEAFATARNLWGGRAALARELGIDTSTLQVLEGKRVAPVSEDMIERVTVRIGWQPGVWRQLAAGHLSYDSRRAEFGGTDTSERMRLKDVPTSELLAEIARRTGP